MQTEEIQDMMIRGIKAESRKKPSLQLQDVESLLIQGEERKIIIKVDEVPEIPMIEDEPVEEPEEITVESLDLEYTKYLKKKVKLKI